MPNNGDTNLVVNVNGDNVVGIGSYHKTLPHNQYGEVVETAFDDLVNATNGTALFKDVPAGPFQPPATRTAAFVNPQAGLAKDQLTKPPSQHSIPAAPKVLSNTTATEMTELYWMALLRDVSFDEFNSDPRVAEAADEISQRFSAVAANSGNNLKLQLGIDIPDENGSFKPITPQNIFRLGLPGEEIGPFVSQFFVREINFGTQKIDQKERPYKKGVNYLTKFASWLNAQNSGNGDDGLAYSSANEARADYYEDETKIRYISTPRDLARFVNKDALHQAYFNAALLLLSGGAKWTLGNPYGDGQPLQAREAGFGTLGGPHILALVSEVATRALKIVWFQKWQTHLRLRPEAYGGLVHLQNIGLGAIKRPYGLPAWVDQTQAANAVRDLNMANGEDSLLLPMAFTAGSPAHPAYGAGHACVAGICITVLKAFFKTLDAANNPIKLICLNEPPPMPADPTRNGCLTERPNPYLPSAPFKTYSTGVYDSGGGRRTEITDPGMTIEGELNKLAMNVAMGRTMGGVHWRTDNARSLTLGEAVAARILADITTDLAEKPKFEFRTFSRKSNGKPKMVVIENGKVKVDGVITNNLSKL